MKLVGYTVIFLGVLFLCGCATPVGYTNKPLQQYDKDTEYRVDYRPDGFSLIVYYSRYQFIPESDVVMAVCKSQVTNIAYDFADLIGVKIKPINEQRIKISMGRNGISGITSCSAMTFVKYDEKPSRDLPAFDSLPPLMKNKE